MPFTQKNKINILKCDGCYERCELGAASNDSYNPTERYKPSINGQTIHRYINPNGKTEIITNWTTYERAIETARTISHLCDNYTPPHLTAPVTKNKHDIINTATYLVSEMIDCDKINKIQDIKIMSLLYLLWLEYQSHEQKYTRISPDSPMNNFDWLAWEYGPANNQISPNIAFIRHQIQNKQIPTFTDAGFAFSERIPLSNALSNIYNYHQHIPTEDLVMFNKYELNEWRSTQLFKPMFTNSPARNAAEVDTYLLKKPLLIQTANFQKEK